MESRLEEGRKQRYIQNEILCKAMQCHTMPRHTMPCHPCHPCHAMPHHAMPCHAMLCHATHAMPCHAMPCHAMPCHAMPCHAMPCHAMPCHAIRAGALGWCLAPLPFMLRVRGLFPGLGCLKETKMFLPHPRVKHGIVGSLRDPEVACWASDLLSLNFESFVWRAV